MNQQQVQIILGIVLIVLQAGVAIVQFLMQQRQAILQAQMKDLIELTNGKLELRQ